MSMHERSNLTRRNAAAFTLIEVMVSIALVLVLILGVNQVFKMAADTVGAGQALSSKIRDGRAAQAVFVKELAHVAPDGPFFYIDSRTQVAFRNAKDQASDLNYNAADTPANRLGQMLSIDLDGDNQEGTAPGEMLGVAVTNDRVHRVDTLSFFARDLYPRQTGNSSGSYQSYIAEQSSNEAWITYGHLRVYDQRNDPDADASYPAPGEGTSAANPKNFFASDWMLGRMAMLLTAPIDTNSDGVGDTIYDRNGTAAANQQYFWMRKGALGPVNNQAVERLEPLGRQTQVSNATTPTISDARYDLAGTTIREFRDRLAEYIDHTVNFPGAAMVPPTFAADDWWTILPCSPVTFGVLPGRFRCDPFPTKPIDSRKAAQAVPPLLNNCTQFMVEFAGDFFTQTASGLDSNVTAIGPDGVIDYYFERPLGNGGPAIRRIRWYGFPRDLTGDGRIEGYIANKATGSNRFDVFVDVVPVRDIALLFDANYYKNTNALAFERHVNQDKRNSSGGWAADPDYTLAPKDNYANVGGGMLSTDYYTAAWGPSDTNRPKMIRLIATVDDANGRLGNGPVYEYVVNLP